MVTLQCADASILGSLPAAARRGFPCPSARRTARARLGLKPADRRAEHSAGFHLVRVQAAKKAFDNACGALPTMSGMQVQGDIITGSKTVLRCDPKPLFAVQESALRER